MTDKRHGVARVISKLGMGSRTQAAQWVREGRVRVNGRVALDPELPVAGTDRAGCGGGWRTADGPVRAHSAQR